MNLRKLQALIIGENFQLIFGALLALKRSGFEIDIITTNRSFLKSKQLNKCELFINIKNLIIGATRKNLDDYDLIIIGDDWTLKNILESELSGKTKLKLLPINKIDNFEHISSKIGLSKTLSKNNVSTPNFAVANNIDETAKIAAKIGFPVFIKIDYSSGGYGSFECVNQEEIYKINPAHFNLPVLVQKKIDGIEFDLSAFYQNGNLIHFHFCEIKKVSTNKFGPSSVRKYFQPSEIDEQTFNDLVDLGKALGANGFTTCSYIRSNDGKGYFIEADMRPNVWADYTKFIGDDIALKISNYFEKGETLNYPILENRNFPKTMIMPFWLRLNFFEILINRYNVWKFISKTDFAAQIDDAYNNFFAHKVRRFSEKLSLIYTLPRQIKRLPTTLIRLAIPDKEDRIRIRNYFKNKVIARQ